MEGESEESPECAGGLLRAPLVAGQDVCVLPYEIMELISLGSVLLDQVAVQQRLQQVVRLVDRAAEQGGRGVEADVGPRVGAQQAERLLLLGRQ